VGAACDTTISIQGTDRYLQRLRLMSPANAARRHGGSILFDHRCEVGVHQTEYFFAARKMALTRSAA